MGEGNAREVLDVFVLFIDDLGEFANASLVGNFFFKDPHVDLGLAKEQTVGTPMRMLMADPQLPDPTMHIFSCGCGCGCCSGAGAHKILHNKTEPPFTTHTPSTTPLYKTTVEKLKQHSH